MPRQTMQDFSKWDIERLSRYSNDLGAASDGRRDRITKKRVDSIIANHSAEDQDMYRLTSESKETLKGFLKNNKTISGTSNYGSTLIHMGENDSLYITIVNNVGENIRFFVDKNMTIEIQDVPRLGDRVGYPFLDPNFSINSLLKSFKDQKEELLKRKKKN